jgi:hypothetical protein
VFTARYALSPYMKQIRFVFKGLNEQLLWLHVMNLTPLCEDIFDSALTVPSHNVSIKCNSRLKLNYWKIKIYCGNFCYYAFQKLDLSIFCRKNVKIKVICTSRYRYEWKLDLRFRDQGLTRQAVTGGWGNPKASGFSICNSCQILLGS